MSYNIFVSCPRQMEYLLEAELIALGLAVSRVSPQGVYGEATLEVLYRLCLCSRLANRVQLILFEIEVSSVEEMLQACRQFAWQNTFALERTFAVEFHGSAPFVNNTMYGGQLIKDGVVDCFNDCCGDRPSVDKKDPDILLHGYLKRQRLTVSLDLVGYSLHQRGYRLEAGGAPLKENVAAAMLYRADWPALLQQAYQLVDPFCGSATLLIEAAMMATNTAPGLLRNDQAFHHWLGHDDAVWQATLLQARQAVSKTDCRIVGLDADARVIEIAQQNIARAGMSEYIQIKPQSMIDFSSQSAPGLLICNPPYGQRLKDPLTLMPLYQSIGQALYQHCQGWQAAILTSNDMLAQAIGLRVSKRYQLVNGALPVVLYCIDVDPSNQLKQQSKDNRSSYMDALYNRLLKNKKHLSKWLKRTKHRCYRLYDADLPDYAFAIDVYNDWAHVQEYAPPKEIPEHKAKKRVVELLQMLPEVLQIPANHIVVKQRRRQKGNNQYQRFDQQHKTLVVTEGEAKFKVNLHDYLDTGLFLDHRLLRIAISKSVRGKILLNCFCYTAAFSVHAALAGALTCNVDLSNTYLSWAKDNFSLNRLPLSRHQFIQADCLQWLQQCRQKFDVIVLDPPSFSNSKRMQTTLDIQRDQVMLVQAAMTLLAEDGVLYFSNNFQRFQLDDSLMQQYAVKDITRQTIDEDFKRKPKMHHCFEIRYKVLLS